MLGLHATSGGCKSSVSFSARSYCIVVTIENTKKVSQDELQFTLLFAAPVIVARQESSPTIESERNNQGTAAARKPRPSTCGQER
jgi:hypothetical protein